MNGAVRALEVAHAAGAEICFANPGTTEMEFVSALDTVRGVRPVLCLFEGVATGAADGWGRIRSCPALTLLHLGPGLANGLANLHNARRAGSPVVNLVGDHAGWHLAADAPLASDIESLARPMSRFVRRVGGAGTIEQDVAEAMAAAIGPPGGVSTLIVPQDAAWDDVAGAPVPGTREESDGQRASGLEGEAIERAARVLRESPSTAGLLVGGRIDASSLEAAAAIREASGCRVWVDTFPSIIAQGRGVPAFEAVPYFPEQASEALSGLETLVLVGTKPPVAFFGYPGGRSTLAPDGCTTITVLPPHHDPAPGLLALASALGAKPAAAPTGGAVEPPADGTLDVMGLGAVLASRQPENAIVVNEGATSSLGWGLHAPNAPRHDVIHLTGGAIGQGLPASIGAALAAPDRRIIALQADGSGMYTLQSLWTMARENLDVTVVVCANRAYRILQFELARSGNVEPGPGAQSLTDLSRPELDWTRLSLGMGVPAVRVGTVAEFDRELARSLQAPGPSLIEALIS